MNYRARKTESEKLSTFSFLLSAFNKKAPNENPAHSLIN